MTKYPAPSPPYLGPVAHTSAGSNKPINRIVIHCTAGSSDTPRTGCARNTAAYFRKPSAGGSAHYIVDSSEVVQAVYDGVVAWHAPPNPHSLGVELCCSLAGQGKDHWQRADHQAMLARAADLVAQLALAYDVPIKKLTVGQLKAGQHGICGHVDVSNAWHESTHWDPGPYFPWADFLAQVKAAADTITGTAPAPTPNKPTQPTDPTEDDMTPDQMLAALESDRGQKAIQNALASMEITVPPNVTGWKKAKVSFAAAFQRALGLQQTAADNVEALQQGLAGVGPDVAAIRAQVEKDAPPA